MSTKRTALITGSLKGLGLETGKHLLKLGYAVIFTGRAHERGDKLIKELNNRDASFIELDVSDPLSIQAALDSALKTHPKIDVLINNAGIMGDEELPTDSLIDSANALNEVFQINTIGPFLTCQILVPLMKKNGFGRVVNVSSGMGQLNEMGNGYPAYRLSKTALNAVTKIFAAEARETNVLANSVCPGWVRTDMGGPDAERSLEEGIETIVWLATLPEKGPSGAFFRDKKEIRW